MRTCQYMVGPNVGLPFSKIKKSVYFSSVRTYDF